MDAWERTSNWGDRGDIFLTGNLRAQEARGISREILNRILNAPSVPEALACLKGTIYASVDSHDVQEILDGRRASLYQRIASHTVHRDLIRLVALPYDYHNLKTGLKNVLHNTDYWDLLTPWGVYSPREIREVFDTEDYGRLPESMEKGLIKAIERYFILKKPAVTDLVLDRAMHGHALDLCRSLDSDILANHWKQRIDMANLRAFARRDLYPDLAGDLFIPGGNIAMEAFSGREDRAMETILGHKDYESLAQVIHDPLPLERETERVLSQSLTLCRFLPWGVEAVYGHVYGVELEIRILGLAFAALATGMNRELLDQRLPVLFGET